MVRISGTFGRPPGDFDLHRQYQRNPARCQRITVSGLTIAKALSAFGAKPYSPGKYQPIDVAEGRPIA